MARIPMTSGFTVIPEGEYVFKITGVTYDEKWGRLEIKLTTYKGLTHTERYTLKDANTDEPNESALNAFSFFAKTALNDFTIPDVDPDELVGHYIRATVEHNKVPNKNNPEKIMTFARLGDKSPAQCYDEELDSQTNNEVAVDDLDSLLD